MQGGKPCSPGGTGGPSILPLAPLLSPRHWGSWRVVAAGSARFLLCSCGGRRAVCLGRLEVARGRPGLAGECCANRYVCLTGTSLPAARGY